MSITKKNIINKIEVVDIYKYVQIKTALIILEDGVELSRKSNRYVLSPDADISGEDAEVQAICNAVWTDEIKAAYETFKESQTNP
tara:strand:+ start:1301 stop:1555 length:255 start_codon:yes stop_codon:yes gene_type:complete